MPRLRRIEPALRRALRGACALPRGARVLVAVSGGADSTALLVALVSLAREFALDPVAAHLHHGVRGAEADADAVHVTELCAGLGVALVHGRRRPGAAGETALRAARRTFLRRTARRTGARAVFTAHTANDQLETLLFRLARGASLRGLGGMAPRRGAFAKPLLEVTREAIEADLRGAGIPWREDASNAGRGAARNRIRHDVVPALVRAVLPDARHGAGVLARRAVRAASDARAAERVLATLGTRRHARLARPGHALPVAALCGPPAVARATARAFWRASAGPRVALRPVHVGAFLDAAMGGPDRVWTMPAGWSLERRRETLYLRAPSRAEARRTSNRAATPRVTV